MQTTSTSIIQRVAYSGSNSTVNAGVEVTQFIHTIDMVGPVTAGKTWEKNTLFTCTLLIEVNPL